MDLPDVWYRPGAYPAPRHPSYYYSDWPVLALSAGTGFLAGAVTYTGLFAIGGILAASLAGMMTGLLLCCWFVAMRERRYF